MTETISGKRQSCLADLKTGPYIKKRRNEVCKELRKDKNKFYEELYNKMEEEKDTKGLYGLTRKLQGTVSDMSPQFYVKDGKQVRKPVEMANLQLSYHRDKIDKIAEKITPSQRNPHRFLDAALKNWEDKDERPVFEFREVTLTEVDEMIATLANSSSFGHDELDSLSIKAAATNLRSPIQFIINSSLKTSNFPMKWKLARIFPRLKSPELDRNEVSSFRPISILSTVSKLVERAAQSQLLKFLESTQQLNPSCHAYRSKMSTTTTLTDMLDEIYQGIEDNKIISMMTVDQSAAFNCLHRDLLLQKLSKYNIGQGALHWVDNYLKYRTQYVVVGASQSRMVPVNHGVPQGSVIGPLLYAIYVNDITEVVKNRGCQESVHNTPSRLFSKQCSKCGILSVYADDSTYTVSNTRRPGNQTSLDRVLDEMRLYLNDNQLSMNVGKTHLTEIMIQQKKGRTYGEPPHLTVETDPGVYKDIRDKTTTRILGANVQANGLWNSHLETGPKALFPQVRKLLGMLRHLGPKIPIRCRNNLSKGLIHSRLSYLMPLWGGASTALIKKSTSASQHCS